MTFTLLLHDLAEPHWEFTEARLGYRKITDRLSLSIGDSQA